MSMKEPKEKGKMKKQASKEQCNAPVQPTLDSYDETLQEVRWL